MKLIHRGIVHEPENIKHFLSNKITVYWIGSELAIRCRKHNNGYWYAYLSEGNYQRQEYIGNQDKFTNGTMQEIERLFLLPLVSYLQQKRHTTDISVVSPRGEASETEYLVESIQKISDAVKEGKRGYKRGCFSQGIKDLGFILQEVNKIWSQN